MRTTLLGSLLDVAARNLARGREAVALFEAGAVYLRGTPPDRGRPAGGQLPRQHAGPGHRAAPLRRARGRPAGAEIVARRRRAGRLLRAEGRARGARRRARLPAARVRADERAVPPPGPQRQGLGRRNVRSAGSARSTRWSAGPGTSPPRSASKSTRRRCSRPRPSATRSSRTSPPSRRRGATSPSSSPPIRPRPTSVAAVLAGGGELLRAGRGLRPLRGRAARRGQEEPGAGARVPRRRPDPDRRGGRGRPRLDPRRAGEDRRDAAVNSDPKQPLDGEPAARVLVAGANGFTGALAAKIVWDHPNLELVAATSRSDAGKRIDALYPRYRVPVTLTELDLDDADFLDGIDAAIVAYPHGAAAPTDEALRAAGIKVVDLSADFRLRDMRHLRALVRRARRARPLRHRRLRPDRDVPGGAARRRPRRHARLLPDRDRARAGAAGRTGPARRGLRRRDAGHLRLRPLQRRPRPLLAR